MRIFRVLLITLFMLFATGSVIAKDFNVPENVKIQQEINQTGFNLLNSSNYHKRITFYLVPQNKVKTKINKRTNRIYVYKGTLTYIEDPNELAALLSLDIAKLMDYKAGFFRQFSISFSPRKYEIKGDKKAVDLMAKAGYNPVALINLMNKTAEEPNWFEHNIMHHKGKERATYIYQYIYEKYPVYIANNTYLKEYEYQNFLRVTPKARKKVRFIQQERIKIQDSEK